MTNDRGWLRCVAPYLIGGMLSAVAVSGNLASIADDMARSGRPVAMFVPIVDEVTSAVMWLALLPVIIFAFRLAVPPRMRLAPALAIHAGLIPLVSLVHFVGTRLIRTLFWLLRGEGYEFHFRWSDYVYDLYTDVLTYLLFGLIAWSVDRFLFPQTAPAPAPIAPPEPTVLEVRDGAQTLYLPAAEILWAEAAGNYVELHLGGGQTVLMRTTLTKLADRLASAGFLRAHRSRLVNAAAVAAVETAATGDAVLLLNNGTRVAASRRYRPAVARAMTERAHA